MLMPLREDFPGFQVGAIIAVVAEWREDGEWKPFGSCLSVSRLNERKPACPACLGWSCKLGTLGGHTELVCW